ncbi:hypothetical protein PAXINDRAFT_14941 [Paxillus involutus ATCC 200175]|uniref:Uncharacterized protein n=1 Tax=Paxillus involutus ATCC 200175 TaxID=664439 RepID=A0A0C9TX22_PAXIN|nr:hypothetical protein PAXINDRAFT_14941 [Paxillus involutus ATCC 200175]
MNANDEDDAPSTPPSPSPPPSLSVPNHPERHHDVNDVKSNKTPAQRRADAVHDPGGETDAPDSVPPSVWLKGERNRHTSLNIEVNNVEMVVNDAEDDDHTQQPSRHPVGTMDGDERHPSEPTEPPDKEEGERG